jgi:GNAT superfamily N-acetyltransferase
MDPELQVRPARGADFAAAARHFHGMRRAMGWPDDALAPGWEDRFAQAHRRSDESGASRYLVAQMGSDVVGSGVAFLRKTLSDDYVRSAPRGFIAYVFVEEPYRRRGVARAITAAALEWLRSVGCETVHLHASEAGKPLYESLGFVTGTEMVLRFAPGKRAP